MKKTIMLFFFLQASILFSAAEQITEKNWRNHPSIVEVRNIFTEIEDNLKNGKIKKQNEINRENENGNTRNIFFFTDKEENIRKCIVETGSDDSAYVISHYYDNDLTLRFVFVQAGAVNGASAEYRIYFDKDGKRIWNNMQYKSKENYSFPSEWPDAQILFNPMSETAVD